MSCGFRSVRFALATCKILMHLDSRHVPQLAWLHTWREHCSRVPSGLWTTSLCIRWQCLAGLTRALARYMLHWRWGPPDGPVSVTCQDPHSKAVLTTKDFPDQEAALKWVLEDNDGESSNSTCTTWHVPGM